jgi:hypothetical protein
VGQSYLTEAADRQAALWAEYQAAQFAYLDTVAIEMHNPTLTQAAIAAIRDEEPPPDKSA